MASIKWSNYTVVCTTIGNQIVIGKKEAKSKFEGLTLLQDKSDDRTRECVTAVMQHMNGEIDDAAESLNFRVEGFGTLTWTPDVKEEVQK